MVDIISMGKLTCWDEQSTDFRTTGIWVPTEDKPTCWDCTHPIFFLLQPRIFLGYYYAKMIGLQSQVRGMAE